MAPNIDMIVTSAEARRIRLMVRPTPHGEAGSALNYGLRVGYWPCLRAPFIQIAIHKWLVELWFGYPSYKSRR
jgi:hypothetical protein